MARNRRTKRELEQMENEITSYLLQNKLDPHKAHEAMIKEYLESHQPIPYYIKGVKDFIKVSQKLAVKLNRKEQMKKTDRERAEQQDEIKEYIMSISKEEAKKIYRQYKDKVTHQEKIILIDVYICKNGNDFLKSYIDQPMINLFGKIYNESFKPAN